MKKFHCVNRETYIEGVVPSLWFRMNHRVVSRRYDPIMALEVVVWESCSFFEAVDAAAEDHTATGVIFSSVVSALFWVIIILFMP